MRCLSLDQMIEPGHRARVVWAYAESCDLTELYLRIRAVEGNVGRNAVDPRLLFALWLFATLESVTSARRLETLTTRDLAFMWLCGGVSVNHHLLSDFRVQHGELLYALNRDAIAVLVHQKLVSLETVAQDGMRVRANAGSASFRKEESLEAALAEAEAHMKQLKEQHEADPAGDERRQQAARESAARERVRRIEQAQAELKEILEQRKTRVGKPPTAARVSTTDPEARRMKMGDGGFRPAYNVQFVTDGGTRLIVSMDVVNQGTDSGMMGPLQAQLREEQGIVPTNILLDGGFPSVDDVKEVELVGSKVHAPLPCEKKHLEAGKNPYTKKPGDSPQMAGFRERMGTKEAKEIYKQRGGIAEFPNAECRNRGLTQYRVRGLVKVKAQTLWNVLAFNFMRYLNLGCLEIVMKG